MCQILVECEMISMRAESDRRTKISELSLEFKLTIIHPHSGKFELRHLRI